MKKRNLKKVVFVAGLGFLSVLYGLDSLAFANKCTNYPCPSNCCDQVNKDGCTGSNDCSICGGSCAACVNGGRCGWLMTKDGPKRDGWIITKEGPKKVDER